jgi:hypothetical protein
MIGSGVIIFVSTSTVSFPLALGFPLTVSSSSGAE